MKNGIRNTLERLAPRLWGSANRILSTLNPPTTTFSHQYSATTANTDQPPSSTPRSGIALAAISTHADVGTAVGAGAARSAAVIDGPPDRHAAGWHRGAVRARGAAATR